MGCGSQISAFEDQPGTDANEKKLPGTILAHTDTSLFGMDTDTLEIQHIGDFNTGEIMTDIAVDSNGDVLGISFESVFRIDPNTAQVEKLSTLSGSSNYNGLSFVPNPNDSNQEILIAVAIGGVVRRIDPQTGDNTWTGDYGPLLTSSGDIVHVDGFGMVATVDDRTEGTTTALARIDPLSFSATIIGYTNHTGIWGLGFWGDTVYGFTRDNEIIGIDPQTGSSWNIKQTHGLSWFGAGVTTRALVID